MKYAILLHIFLENRYQTWRLIIIEQCLFHSLRLFLSNAKIHLTFLYFNILLFRYCHMQSGSRYSRRFIYKRKLHINSQVTKH